jgi:hypothetical protein
MTNQDSPALEGTRWTPNDLPASDWVLYASLNEELISKEIRLISDRTGWLNTTQSFLFGAFCLIALSSNNKTETAQTLMLLIPVLGILTLAACVLGVIGARQVIEELEREREEFQIILNKKIWHKPPRAWAQSWGSNQEDKALGWHPF